MMKVAIVCDFLTQVGGAERTVLAMCDAFPEAPVFTSIYSPDKTIEGFKNRDIKVSDLQVPYRLFKSHRVFLPFYPKAFEDIDLKGFDLILSSSSAFAHGVRKPAGALHVSYCHNPARFLWMKDAYLAEERSAFLKDLYIRLFLDSLQRWDLNAAKNVDHFICNSHTVRGRIKNIYKRDADVIHPPIDCGKFGIAEGSKDYYLVVSRLLAHKRINVTIQAFNLLGVPLKIVGAGPHYPTLKAMASKNIEFVGVASDTELAQLYSRCKALICPQEEEFGIAPVEANASGRPVVAFARGGILETMKSADAEGEAGTAVFFHRQTAADVVNAVEKLQGLRFDPQRLRENALRFDKPVFIAKIRKRIEELWTSRCT